MREALMEYSMPGMWVREQTVPVPLDWWDEARGEIEVFVREVVDPDKRGDDLPLLTFLQGGPGGSNPRPTDVSGWMEEVLKDYRLVMVDQRGTGRSTPIDAQVVAEIGDAEAGAEYLAKFRADSIVRDLEHVRSTLYEGRKWALLAQSYGGWLTCTYLSHAPGAIAAAYVCGGIPGIPASADKVYRHTFDRVAAKTAEYYRRYPQDVERVAAIADRLAADPVHLPDGDVLTVRRFQSLGLDLGMKPGMERMHWLVEDAFIRDDRLSEGFLTTVLNRTSSANNPLFWTLQEAIYGDGPNGPTAWAAQRERDRRPDFGEEVRPLQFTGEAAFPWMFDEIRLLRGLAPAVHALAERREWSPQFDLDRLAANDVPVAAAVYFEDMYVESGLQLETLKGLGNSQAWVTNEFEHDGLLSGRVLTRLRELVRDRGGEQR